MTISLAVLISGGGTTLRNLVDRIREGRLDARVNGVVCSRPDAPGIHLAHDAGLPCRVVPRKAFTDGAAFSAAVTEAVDSFAPDLVVMGGFLSLWTIPDRYLGRVMNIHPALIPAFCGKGFFGHRVHEAVVASGVKVTGCTVHFADNEYDRGPIILQRAVPVSDHDTPDDVAARVFAEECAAYPEAIRLFAEGRLRIDGRRVVILPGTPPPVR
ncbi:MAG: phosphoribosylglycinamide formyltransferase [Planctomycetes bacterium]|jgi:formyltetrahydrofolate-dependent phosphoribosylglycinamide formyltransferase|nr:phosphoribosylglycinamide formyltransferase [Planctomycetota bacterium]